MMKTYEFSVVASGLDPSDENFEAQFYDAGCDDALVSFQKGHTIVDFARKAESIEEAILSAVEAVRATGARVDRVEPDPLVNLSDMASRSEMTRSAMCQYAKGQRRDGFPVPFAKVTSDSPLWQWDVVAKWLHAHGKVTIEVVIQADVVREINKAICNGVDLRQAVLVARAA